MQVHVFARVLLTLGLLAFVTGSWAAVVVQMGVSQLFEGSEVVVHGRVIASQSRWTADRKSIVTDVTLEVLDGLKGEAPREITLTFTGGSVDGLSLALSGLRVPALGDEGVYFIESVSGGLDCPIIGWNQGHFRVRSEGNQRRVFTSDGHPVKDLGAGPGPRGVRFNEDVASGVAMGDGFESALSVRAFKSRLRGITGGAR